MWKLLVDKKTPTWYRLDMFRFEHVAQLITLYSTPGRYYHTWEHVQHCLREYTQFLRATGKIVDTSILQAIAFHDAVYDPKAIDGSNEEFSAALASDALWTQDGTEDKSWQHDICEMIRATKNHFEHEQSPEGTKIFLDVDLAILGQDRETYAKYAENIRKEFSWVPIEIFKQERKKFLESAKKLRSIYYTEYFREKYEVQARFNIQWELSQQ